MNFSWATFFMVTLGLSGASLLIWGLSRLLSWVEGKFSFQAAAMVALGFVIVVIGVVAAASPV